MNKYVGQMNRLIFNDPTLFTCNPCMVIEAAFLARQDVAVCCSDFSEVSFDVKF